MHAGKAMCAHMLVTPTALANLSFDDALIVVDYMQPTKIEQGTTLFTTGQDTENDYMLLIIEGDVTVESSSSGDAHVIIDVVGAGHMIGEMGLLDGSPRSATCSTASDVTVAVLSRDGLTQLIEEHPKVASQLLLAIACRIADRLRQANRKLFALSQVNKAQKQEMDALMPARRGVANLAT